MSRGLTSLAGRRILLLNWRDLRHPRAGGAEVYCQEIGERFAAAGAEVTLFTSDFPGAPLAEMRGGVDVLRCGGTFGVYLRAAQHLRRRRRPYDAVVDFQNGIPFFAPLFAGSRTAVVCVIHHVHQEQFALHFPWPVSRVGQLLEGPVSRRVYQRRPLVAVSPSTRRDIRRRLRLRGPIHVVPNGMVAVEEAADRVRSTEPRITVVSRLVSHKRFDLLVDAVPDLIPRWPGLRVDVAGDGPERPALERRAAAAGLRDVVRFHGRVDTCTRDRLLREAWLTVSPSQAEGWGLTMIEANAAGVPGVAFDVAGLRDSVVHGETGWLLPPDRSLASGLAEALEALEDPVVADGFTERCRAWASRFSWDSSAQRLAGIVAGEIDRVRRLPRSRRIPSDLGIRLDARVEEVVDADEVFHGRIRRSDQWVVKGRDLSLLLHGCDEAGAEVVLRRIGVEDVRRLSLATSNDLLIGAA
ncbi:glycosyltransferase family 4 protein [Geodermatophilus sp. SYSU D00758]